MIFSRKAFEAFGEAAELSGTVWLVSEISSPRRALGEILSEDTELSACVVRGVSFVVEHCSSPLTHWSYTSQSSQFLPE